MINLIRFSEEIYETIESYLSENGYDLDYAMDDISLKCYCYEDGNQPMFAAIVAGKYEGLEDDLNAAASIYTGARFCEEFCEDDDIKDYALVLRCVIDWEDEVDEYELARL